MNKKEPQAQFDTFQDDDEISLLDLLFVIVENIRLLILGPIAVGLIALGLTFFIPSVYTAETSFAPPSDLSGGMTRVMGYLNGGDLRDQIIEKLELQKHWKQAKLDQARDTLKKNLKIKNDGKTGVITLEYSDANASLAAQIINEYVELLASRLIADAKLDFGDKRMLIQNQLAELSKSTQSNVFAREVIVAALIQQLSVLRKNNDDTTLVQSGRIVRFDVAKPPETRNDPKRALIVVVTLFATGFLLLLFVFIREGFRNASNDPESAAKLQRIRRAFGRER